MKQAAALEKTAPRSGSVSTLTAAASNLAAASIAKNTWIAYQGALGRLQNFLRKEGRDLTGLDDSQLAEYLTRLHGSGASPASAAMVCAAVRFLAKTMGQPSPVGPLSGRVMAGLRREGKDRGRGQVQGLQWGQADTAAAVASNGGQSLAGLRDAALIAVMSDCLLRVSEAVALQVDGLQLESDGPGRLTIGQSKNRSGRGRRGPVRGRSHREPGPGVDAGRLYRVGADLPPGPPWGQGDRGRFAFHAGRPRHHPAPRRRRRFTGALLRAQP